MKILCKIGIHRYKFNIDSDIAPINYAMRFWRCIKCGKANHKKNGQELLWLKDNVQREKK